MPIQKDIFSGVALCSHSACQWETSGGWSGIEARYKDSEGNPACFTHRDEGLDNEDEN